MKFEGSNDFLKAECPKSSMFLASDSWREKCAAIVAARKVVYLQEALEGSMSELDNLVSSIDVYVLKPNTFGHQSEF